MMFMIVFMVMRDAHGCGGAMKICHITVVVSCALLKMTSKSQALMLDLLTFDIFTLAAADIQAV